MKYLVSCYISKLIYLLSKILKIGSGYTAPGYYVLKIFPDILKCKQIKFTKGLILVSGTNGKTTTTKLITHILEDKFKVTTNQSGSNLLRGIVSAILLNTNFFGRLKGDFGVLEVDELTLPAVLKYLEPDVIVFTNLSRDQLDRYWEIENVFDRWVDSLKKIHYPCKVLCDTDQLEFKDISKLKNISVEYFDSSDSLLNITKLKGLHNCKNVNAAVLAVKEFGILDQTINEKLQNFDYAYGRGEVVKKYNKDFKILLAKNPASYNNNLSSLVGDTSFDTAFLILNDNIPDGRDISWIYDIDTKLFNDVLKDKKIYVSGTRFLDMQIRCKYAYIDVDEKNVGSNLKNVAENIGNDSFCKNVLVLPNYSAMLKIRKILKGSKIL